MLTPEQISQSIERAKAKVAAIQQAKLDKQSAFMNSLQKAAALPVIPAAVPSTTGHTWNTEQEAAISNAYFGKSFCLIGAAGTGKTTTLKALLARMLENHRIPPLESSTKHLKSGAPGVALISYTRRAVRNIAKQMEASLKGHCITFHKLVEYEPEQYEEKDSETGTYVTKMRFAPQRNRSFTLPSNLKLIVVDESSMLSIDYFNQVLAALPQPSQVQFIFLGDLNQLPPVYGQAILGKMLLELPIIELTRVYRQALESPIISLALAVKDNNFKQFESDCNSGTFTINGAVRSSSDLTDRVSLSNVTKKLVIEREGRGKVTLQPWKKQIDKDDVIDLLHGQFKIWAKDGTYNPEEDLVLCPWNKSVGTDELNKGIAQFTGDARGAEVHEVIAGFNKYYYAVGDKLLVDKEEAIILDIRTNYRYVGKRPQAASTTMNRWGEGGAGFADIFGEELTDDQLDALLHAAADVSDRTAAASHIIRVKFLDRDTEEDITDAATLNATTFAYAITVHKAQGSECRKVFFITHECHSAMCSRELVYTAFTRAAEELHVVMAPKMIAKAAARPRIKGDTLAEKLEFFKSRLEEKEE